MERLACVDIPRLALQILLDRHRDWKDEPAVVVNEDSPQGMVMQVNRVAREHHILPGMRYAAALSLHGDLRAGVVEPQAVTQAMERLQKVLFDFSPHIEPFDEEPGLFWLRVTGFDRLFGSFESWGRQLYERVRDEGFYPSTVVGFTRFGTYAAARSQRPGLNVFDAPADEKRRALNVPLAHLDIDPKARDALARLGIETVGAFIELPADGVQSRFGEQAAAVYRFASGAGSRPLQPLPYQEPARRRLDFDEPEQDRTRLVFRIKAALPGLLMELAARHQVLSELVVTLRLTDGDMVEESIRPARPSLEEGPILDLLRLRLERSVLTAGVASTDLLAVGVEHRQNQMHLFHDGARRDLEAANHALARLRAEFGEEAVVRAVPKDDHPPERQFELEPLERLEHAEPGPAGESLVRRFFLRAEPLPRFQPEVTPGWMIRSLDEGCVTESFGPYAVSGDWWQGKLYRDYYFVRTRRGDLFWAFYDHKRQQWFLQGKVE